MKATVLYFNSLIKSIPEFLYAVNKQSNKIQKNKIKKNDGQLTFEAIVATVRAEGSYSATV